MPYQKQNSWSRLTNIPDPLAVDFMTDVGGEALTRGVIRPEDAQANIAEISPVLRAMGVNPDPLLNVRIRTMPTNVPSRNPAVFDKVQMPEISVSPVQKGSGLSRQGKASQQGEHRTQSSHSQYMTPEQLTQLYENFERVPALQNQAQGIEQLRDMLAMEAQMPTQVDLSPLMALTDSISGTKLAQSYARPDTESRRRRLLDYSAKIQDDRRDLAKTIMDFIGKQKTGTVTESDVQKSAQDYFEKAEDPLKMASKPPNAASLKPKAYSEFQKYVKDDLEALSSSQNALKTLTSGTKVGVEAFKNFMARASGEKGPLTESDIARFSGDPAIASRLSRVFTKYTEGSLTAQDEADMKLLAEKYVEFRKDTLKKKSDYFTDQVAPGAFMMNPDEAKKLLIPSGGFGLREDQYNKKKAPAPTDDMVSVISPDGKRGKVPRSKLEAAMGKGYKKVE